MHDDGQRAWTLEKHLSIGAVALTKIDMENANAAPQPICHHFSQVNPVDPITISVTATYRHLCPRFSGLGLDFLPDRLEAWETTQPNGAWLVSRIPAIFDLAEASGLIYQGWTWEPRDRQPIGATDFQVINNRTDKPG